MREIIKEFIDKLFDFFENKQKRKEEELNNKFKKIEDLIKESFNLSDENKILNIKVTKLSEKLNNLENQKKQNENLINKQTEEIERLKQQQKELENRNNDNLIKIEEQKKEIQNLKENQIKELNNQIITLNQQKKEVEKKNDDNLIKIREQKREIQTLKENNQNKENEIKELNNQISILKQQKSELENKNNDNLTKIEEQKREIQDLKENNQNKENEIKELTPKVEQLSQIDYYLNKDKKVLETLLRVDSLEEFRKKSGIIQDDYISLLNLAKLLVSKNVIIEGYYNKLLEYKQQNPEPMSDIEQEFYQSLNNYFDEEIIDLQNIEFKSFDRDKMIGLNGEYKGEEIQNPKVIIPTHDSYNLKKARILVKG